MEDFLNEIRDLWWIEVGTKLTNPKSEECIRGLKNVLRENFELDNDVIQYIVEALTNSPSNFSMNVGKPSGINVGDNQTAVSAQLHPDWDDEDDTIYNTDLDEDEEEKDDEEKKDGDRPDSGDDKEAAEKDIQKASLTALEKDKLKKEAIDDKLLKTKLTNPTTGNPNQVSTLLGKKKSDPAAYKVGKDFLGDKGVSDDEIEKATTASTDDTKSTSKSEPQANGYVGDKDKSLKQGDPTKSEVYSMDLPPDEADFQKRNAKFANPTPPEAYKMPDFMKNNPKFPKKYLTALERMMNTRPTGDATKWQHYSDISGGAGQVSAQAGELMTMMGSTMSDDEWNEFSNSLLQHEKALKDEHPDVFMKKDKKTGKYKDNPGSRVVDGSWVKSATQSRKAIQDRLKKQYGDGVEIVAGAWDTQDDVEAMGLSNYNDNKGFSTDMYLKVKKPNGEEVLDEVSLKKSTKVNFLNSSAGKFNEWDPDLTDEINPSVYVQKARERNISYVSRNRAKIEELMKSSKGKKINAVLKSKKLTFEQALEGNSRDKQKVLWTAINSLAKAGDKSASEIVARDDREHREFQENSVKAITENPKMKEGMLSEIRSEFPLKAVSEGEETMAIGPYSLDKETMKTIFGTDDYEKLKENLLAESSPEGPFIGYRIQSSGEVFKVADIVIREDGRGYGGQFKFEMKLNQKGFANQLRKAQSEVYG